MPYKWDFSIVSLPPRWVSLFCTVKETWSWLAYFWYYFHCNALNPHQIVQMARVGVQVDFKGHVVVIQGRVRRMYFLKKHMFNSGMNGFNFIRILKLSDFLDVSTQVLAIHLMWKMATPDQSLEVTNRPQLKHNFHRFSRFWLFPVIKLYLVVVWYNKERSFEITPSQVPM